MRYPLREFPIRNVLKSFVGNYVLRRPVPLLLSLSVTHRCNARCPFCDFWKSEPVREMNVDEINGIFEDAYDLGCLTAVVTGGEALLRRDLPTILKNADEAGLSTLLLTNGYLLAKRIREIHRNLDIVGVSIDFPDSRHDKTRGIEGLFDKAVEGIKLAQGYGLSTNINSIITSLHSLEDIEALLSLAESLNSGITFSPIFNLPEVCGQGTYIGKLSKEGERIKLNDWNAINTIVDRLLYYKKHRYRKVLQNTAAYLELVKNRGNFTCHPLSLQIGVSPSGEVGALCSLGLFDCYSLGNALEHSLKEIWYSEKAEQLRGKFKECKLSAEAGCYLLCVAELSLMYDKPSMIMDYVKRLF
jgi:MoaA/NifB/PqqE/SkfB family radical SAM enzyme